MKRLMAVVVLVGALAGCSGTNESCKDACVRLQECQLGSPGLSCDSECDAKECAACINEEDNACNEVAARCAAVCPGVVFQ
jgi:hypothetical protein